MPYASDKQRKFMHAQHPGIAARWDQESRPVMKDERAGHGKKDAAVGAGAVATGAGLVGGGIPGLESQRLISDFKQAKGLKKVGVGARIGRGGIFGHRATIHGVYGKFELNDKKIRQNFPGPRKVDTFLRAQEAGKLAPEKHVIRHLKRGRIGSNVILAGGLGALAYGATNRKKQVTKADRESRNARIAAGGGALAGLSVGGTALAEQQGRRWAGRSRATMEEVKRIDPRFGAYTVTKKPNTKYGRAFGKLRVADVKPDLGYREIRRNPTKHFRGMGRDKIDTIGRLRGSAAQTRHFADVYGKTGKVFSRVVAPIGLATAAAGGAGMAMDRHRKRNQPVGKSLAELSKAVHMLGDRDLANARFSRDEDGWSVGATVPTGRSTHRGASFHRMKWDDSEDAWAKHPGRGQKGRKGRSQVTRSKSRAFTLETTRSTLHKADPDYEFLPSNIRQEVEWGIPETRRNPVSPLEMLAAANLAAGGYTEVKRHWPIGKKKRRERGMFKLGIAEQLGNSGMRLGA